MAQGTVKYCMVYLVSPEFVCTLKNLFKGFILKILSVSEFLGFFSKHTMTVSSQKTKTLKSHGILSSMKLTQTYRHSKKDTENRTKERIRELQKMDQVLKTQSMATKLNTRTKHL
jgi:hypothetical protein